jgi:uncharacterized membrane protein
MLNTKIALLCLRLIHIVAGVLWVGGAAVLVAFIIPAAREGKDLSYLRQIIWKHNLPRYLNVTLALALLSGLTMYSNLMIVTQGAYGRSRIGTLLGLGGALAIVAALIATFVAAPAVHRALQLDNNAAAGNGDPQASRVALQRYEVAMRVVVALLVCTAALMGIARYA